MSDAVRISVLRKSQPVELELAEGELVLYAIKEMTGAQRDEYLNKVTQKTTRDASGEVVGMKDYKGLYSTLLSFCLYDADSKLIPESKIQEWPDTAQKALFDIAIELNGLKAKKADEGSEKND
jgi:hypothetical protein